MKRPLRHMPRSLIAIMLALAATPAAAHHPMGGATPGTLLEGLLSGFGHPVIGIDHLLFIVAVGIACYYFGQRVMMIAATLLGALAGTLLHVQAPGLPYHDVFVALSLIVLGVVLIRRHDVLRSTWAALLFAASGLAHGYAYGEAIVGAETTPLLAYLVGFTLMQFAIAFGGYALARFVSARRLAFAFLPAAGATLAAVGAGFLAFSQLAAG